MNTSTILNTKTYKQAEIYISKTIITYDEYGNVISRDVVYDKDIKYAERTNPYINKIQPVYNTNYYNHNHIQGNSSTHTSPSSSIPTSPISPSSPNSVSIDMTNISMYNS
jgi:hypothetical protein